MVSRSSRWHAQPAPAAFADWLDQLLSVPAIHQARWITSCLGNQAHLVPATTKRRRSRKRSRREAICSHDFSSMSRPDGFAMKSNGCLIAGVCRAFNLMGAVDSLTVSGFACPRANGFWDPPQLKEALTEPPIDSRAHAR